MKFILKFLRSVTWDEGVIQQAKEGVGGFVHNHPLRGCVSDQQLE